MGYAAEVFIEENGDRVFHLYTGHGQFVPFRYDVGDLLVVAINIANDKDAYKEERKLRMQKLMEAPPVQVSPGVVVPDWFLTDSASQTLNFAAFTSAVELMPEEQLSAFASNSFPLVPANPWERGELGFDAHYSFDRMTKATRISFKSLFDALLYDAFEVKKYHIKPTRCQNCGKLFFPHSRSDEIYCNYIFRNGKTCKELGYEMKVEADQIMKEYRRIYKMQNARKQRNQQKRNIAACFDEWTAFAKQKLKACQNGEITLDEMKQQISGADWMP